MGNALLFVRKEEQFSFLHKHRGVLFNFIISIEQLLHFGDALLEKGLHEFCKWQKRREPSHVQTLSNIKPQNNSSCLRTYSVLTKHFIYPLWLLP